MAASDPIQVCFVCLGNICRSPLAEGVFQDLVNREGLEERILVHSAGTSGWHIGSPADARMQATANKYGVELTSKAEQFDAGDFRRFDLVLAMDQSNHGALETLASTDVVNSKLRMFRSFDPEQKGDLDVPDPYYGGNSRFETVYRMVQRTCPEILAYIKAELL